MERIVDFDRDDFALVGICVFIIFFLLASTKYTSDWKTRFNLRSKRRIKEAFDDSWIKTLSRHSSMVNIVGFGVNFEKLGNESNNENGENDNNGGDDDSNQGGGSQSCSSKLDKNLNSLEKKEKDKNDSRSYTKEDTNQDLFIEDSDDGDGSDISILDISRIRKSDSLDSSSDLRTRRKQRSKYLDIEDNESGSGSGSGSGGVHGDGLCDDILEKTKRDKRFLKVYGKQNANNMDGVRDYLTKYGNKDKDGKYGRSNGVGGGRSYGESTSNKVKYRRKQRKESQVKKRNITTYSMLWAIPALPIVFVYLAAKLSWDLFQICIFILIDGFLVWTRSSIVILTDGYALLWNRAGYLKTLVAFAWNEYIKVVLMDGVEQLAIWIYTTAMPFCGAQMYRVYSLLLASIGWLNRDFGPKVVWSVEWVFFNMLVPAKPLAVSAIAKSKKGVSFFTLQLVDAISDFYMIVVSTYNAYVAFCMQLGGMFKTSYRYITGLEIWRSQAVLEFSRGLRQLTRTGVTKLTDEYVPNTLYFFNEKLAPTIAHTCIYIYFSLKEGVLGVSGAFMAFFGYIRSFSAQLEGIVHFFGRILEQLQLRFGSISPFLQLLIRHIPPYVVELKNTAKMFASKFKVLIDFFILGVLAVYSSCVYGLSHIYNQYMLPLYLYLSPLCIDFYVSHLAPLFFTLGTAISAFSHEAYQLSIYLLVVSASALNKVYFNALSISKTLAIKSADCYSSIYAYMLPHLMVLWSHLILTSNIVASLALDLVCEVIDRIKIFFQLSGSVVIRLLGEGHEAINDILKSANEVLNSATERLGDGIFFFSQYGANFSDNTADDGSKAYKAGIVETDDKYESYGGSTRQRKSRRAKVD